MESARIDPVVSAHLLLRSYQLLLLWECEVATTIPVPIPVLVLPETP